MRNFRIIPAKIAGMTSYRWTRYRGNKVLEAAARDTRKSLPKDLKQLRSPSGYTKQRIRNTIYIRGPKTWWGSPWRTRWIAQTIGHESVHIVLDDVAGVEASVRLDNLPDALWKQYC